MHVPIDIDYYPVPCNNPDYCNLKLGSYLITDNLKKRGIFRKNKKMMIRHSPYFPDRFPFSVNVGEPLINPTLFEEVVKQKCAWSLFKHNTLFSQDRSVYFAFRKVEEALLFKMKI